MNVKLYVFIRNPFPMIVRLTWLRFTFVLDNVFMLGFDNVVDVCSCPNLTLLAWFCNDKRRVSRYTEAYTNTITDPGNQKDIHPAMTEKY